MSLYLYGTFTFQYFLHVLVSLVFILRSSFSETSLIPKLPDYIQFWKRYVDDTICFIKVGSVNYILSVLNSFDVNIKFTYELEHEGELPFLDVLLCRTGKKIYATVYRKATNNNVYLNWNAFTSINWKRGTLKTLIECAYLICITDKLHNRELKNVLRKFSMKTIAAQSMLLSKSYNNYLQNIILQQMVLIILIIISIMAIYLP